MATRIIGSLLFALLATLVLLSWAWAWLELMDWAGHAFGGHGIILSALGWPIFTILTIALSVSDKKQGSPG